MRLQVPLFVSALSDRKLIDHLDRFERMATDHRAKPASRRPEDSPYWSLLLEDLERRNTNKISKLHKIKK